MKSTAYETIGCYKDIGADRAIPTLEGKDMILDGVYQARIHATEKCYEATKKRGFKVFAVQDGGCCASSATAETTFDKHGPSSACGFDGEGGPGANQVYFIRGIKFAVFFNDSVFNARE